MYFEENKRRPSKMGKTKTGGTIREQEKNIKGKERDQRKPTKGQMNREERSSVEDDQREHGTMDDEGRKKQVQVTRRSLRHKVTSVDANTSPFPPKMIEHGSYSSFRRS